MENTAIAKTLNEFANLLETSEEIPFRNCSCRQAGQVAQGLSRPAEKLIEEVGELHDPPGIGECMEDHRGEFFRTGALPALDELDAELPGSLGDVVGLKGAIPKRTRKFCEVVGVTSVDDLTETIEDEKATSLEGYGVKAAEQMLEAGESADQDRGAGV